MYVNRGENEIVKESDEKGIFVASHLIEKIKNVASVICVKNNQLIYWMERVSS